MISLLFATLNAIGVRPVLILAELIGVQEAALKLLLTITLAYPISILYLSHFKSRSHSIKHLFFVIIGLDIAYYNFGLTLYHNAVPVLFMYLTILIFKPGPNSVMLTFAFNMTYLLVGYVMTESEDYDITWTMPHCVLTLKLIALSFDMWDGQKLLNGKELSINNRKTAIVEAPTLLELFGFIYFPACFLVGPMFSFKRYHDFIHDMFPLDNAGEYKRQACNRLVQGLVYLAAYQVGVSVFSMKYMLSEEFWENSIFYRHFYCGMWAHFALYKYISCWLLTEASCIRIGFSYNGEEAIAGSINKTKWDGCNNIQLLKFEAATKFQHYIDSFNCNTNHFAAEYIYKRLKFLGDKNLSQLFTLLFLAVWHGIRSGYYVTFLNEFIIIIFEKGFESIVSKTKIYHTVWASSYGKVLLYGLLKIYTIVFMGWSLVPFDVKVFSKWFSVYASLYFSGFLLFLPWGLLYRPALIYAFKVMNVQYIKTKE